MMRRGWVRAGMAMVAMSLVGCASSETGEGGDPPVTATSAAAGGCTSAEAATDLESVLRFVPDTNANRELVQVADLEAFLADQGKRLPDDFREIELVDPVNLFTPTPMLQDAL